MEDVKVKLAVLWLAFFCTMVTMPTLELYLPGYIGDIIIGEMAGMELTAGLILFLAIVMLIPPSMAVLTFTSKDSINRWLSIIMGIVMAVLSLVFPIIYLAEQDAYYAGPILIGIAEFVFATLIIWFAWEWQ